MRNSYGRNVYQDLANISGRAVKGINMEKLASRYGKAVQERKALEAEYGKEFHLNIPHVAHVQNKIAQELEAQAQEINAYLPVASIYDAYAMVKSHKDLDKDPGLRALRGQLETMWKRNRSGSITAQTYLTLHDHYKRNYPKSAAAEVIENIGQDGYTTLPLTDLTRIASEIYTQDDFDKAMVYHGLNGKAPHQVKARRYILALINEDEEDVRPFCRAGGVETSSRQAMSEGVDIIANLGDVDFITHDGFLVVDRGDGPEGLDVNNNMDDGFEEKNATWTISRISLDPDPFFANEEDISSLASFTGQDPQEILDDLQSGDPVRVGWVYRDAISYWGAYEFNQSPMEMNYREVHEFFGEEVDDEDEDENGMEYEGSRQAGFETDESLVAELVLYIENDGELYQRRFVPIAKNLSRKWQNGTYDSELAVQGWMYLVIDGAKKYAQDFGDASEWHQYFPPEIRQMAAQQFAEQWEAELEIGNLME